MRLPIDTATVKFAAAGPAEPVLDFETRQPKTDENGVPLFNVPVFAAGSGVKDSITIKVAGEVKGLSEFTIVKITNLIASNSLNTGEERFLQHVVVQIKSQVRRISIPVG